MQFNNEVMADELENDLFSWLSAFCLISILYISFCNTPSTVQWTQVRSNQNIADGNTEHGKK